MKVNLMETYSDDIGLVWMNVEYFPGTKLQMVFPINMDLDRSQTLWSSTLDPET